MAAANAFALLGSEESQDVARFIAAEQATAKAAKEVANALARKKRKAAPKKKKQIDMAPGPRMMRAKRIILPYHVRRSDIVIRKEKKEDGDSHSNNNGSVEKKSDLSVQKKVEQKVEQNGNGLAVTDNKNSRVVSQGGRRTSSDPNGGVADNNYRGNNRQGNYRNYRDGNGFRPNRSNRGRRMNENNGYRSGTEGQITNDNGGSREEEEEGWKYVGTRSRSRSSSISGDGRRGPYGRVNNGFRGQKHQYQRRSYNGNDDNRRSNVGNTEETINGDNVSNQPEKNQVTEDNNKTDGAQRAICEPTEEHKGKVRGQKDSKAEEAQDADEEKLKRREYEEKLKRREYEAKLMTLDQYEKVLSRKKKTLDGPRQTEQQQRMVTLDKEFESMQLVGKKKEAGPESEQQQGKLKKKDGTDKEEKAHKSMSIDFLQPASYRTRNGERLEKRPFSGRGQQDERFNPNSVTRPRDPSRNFPRKQERNPVLDTGGEKDNEAFFNTECAKDFPALTAAPLPTRP